MTSTPPFASARAHPGHAFDGMRIVAAAGGERLIVARCSCGDVLDVADAVFAPCAEHAGSTCARCGGSGEIVDHRALVWRPATAEEIALLGGEQAATGLWDNVERGRRRMNPLHTHRESPKRADQRAVRSFNLGAVAREITECGARSRAQIAVATGLNKTTVSSLVSELIARGVVRETGLDADGSVGRPAQVLALNGERIAGLGLEINVDYMTVCACDLRGRVRHHAMVGHDNRENPPEVVIEELARLAGEAISACDELGLTVVGAGVCVPGLVDSRTSMLAYAPNLLWRRFALGDSMRAALDDPPFPIRVDNDANLAALGELESGALRGVRHALMLYGGIGVGGAVIIDGAIFRGADGFAGEIGHIPVRPQDGERCSCGARGCLETLVGQEAIARMVGISGARSEAETPAVVLAARLRAGDRAALQALEDVASVLGIGISAAVNTVNPQRVVLGGTFATLAEWLLPGVAASLADRIPNAAPAVELRASELGEAATVRGGAALVLHELLADPLRAPLLEPLAAAGS